MANEYRFEMPASVIFSVRAATLEEAEAKAKAIRDKEIDGFDADPLGDDAEGYENRVYFDENGEVYLHDMTEDVDGVPKPVHYAACPNCQDRPGFDGLGRTCKTCKGSGRVVVEGGAA